MLVQKKYIVLTLSLLDSHKTIPGPPRCSWHRQRRWRRAQWGLQRLVKVPLMWALVWPLSDFIVNDREVAVDLLDKRSAIYSSRPALTFGGELYVDSRQKLMHSNINYSLWTPTHFLGLGSIKWLPWWHTAILSNFTASWCIVTLAREMRWKSTKNSRKLRREDSFFDFSTIQISSWITYGSKRHILCRTGDSHLLNMMVIDFLEQSSWRYRMDIRSVLTDRIR